MINFTKFTGLLFFFSFHFGQAEAKESANVSKAPFTANPILTVKKSAYIYRHKRNFNYRLGDMFRFQRFRDMPSSGRLYHYKHFPHSIASEYMRRTDESNQYAILNAICNQRYSKNHVPQNNTLVIHLRAGDVIDSQKYTVKEFLSEQRFHDNGCPYVRPMRFYRGLVSAIRSLNLPVDAIELISGFHTKSKSKEKSFLYIAKIKQYFESEGFKVSTRIDFPADADFLYMTNARYFTPSGGGFSMIIKNMVEMRGGNIITPI